MSVRFVVGRAGSGKTWRCLEAIRARLREDAARGPRLLLIVPEQASFQMERAIIETPDIPGFTRCEVLSFQRLAYRIFAETGADPRRGDQTIGSLGRLMVIRRLIRQERPSLRLLGRVADKPGLIRQVAGTIDELMREDVEPDKIAEVAAAAEAEDPLGAARLADIARLYRAYLDYLVGDRVDPAQYLHLAAGRLDGCEWLTGAEVWVDGFAGFTRQEYHLLAALADRVKNMELTILVDPAASAVVSDDLPAVSYSRFARAERTLVRLRKEFTANGVDIGEPIRLDGKGRNRFSRPELASLEQNLFLDTTSSAEDAQRPEAIRLFEFTDRRAEVQAAVAEIRRLTREADPPLRYRDVAIIVRDLTAYHDLISAAMRSAGIPCFIDRREPTTHHPLVELVRGLLALAVDDCAIESVRLTLKTGLLPIEPPDADLLENYLIAHGIAGRRRWSDPWNYTRFFRHKGEKNQLSEAQHEVLARINDMRGLWLKTLDPWLETVAERHERSGRDWMTAFFGCLERMEVGRHLEAWAGEAAAADRTHAADTHRQVWRDFVELADEFVRALGGEPMRVEEFRETIEAGLAEFNLGLAPPTLDEVLVGAIERSRHPAIRVALLLGFDESHYPMKRAEDPLIGDAEREAMKRAGAEIGPARPQRLVDERMLTYIALTRASEGIWLSYPRRESDGKTLQSSAYLEEVIRAVPGLKVEVAGDPAEQRSLARLIGVSDLGARLAHELRYREPIVGEKAEPVRALWNTVYAAVREREDWHDVLRRSLAGLKYRNDAMLEEGLIDQAAGSPFTASVSRLESFAACPFRHFAEYLLRLEDRIEAELARVDVGTLCHTILERLALQLDAEKRQLADLEDDEITERVDAIAKALGPEIAAEIMLEDARNNYLVDRSRGHLSRVARWQRNFARRGKFRTKSVEFPFGFRDEKGRMVELTTPKGRTIRLRGKIDRVDLAEVGKDMLGAVFDYKTTHERKLSLTEVLHGLALQLITYLLAIEKTGESLAGRAIKPAAALYMPLLENYEKVKHPNEAKKKSYQARGLVSFDTAEHLDEDITATGSSTFMSARVTKNGEPYSNCDLVRPHHFQAVLDHVKGKIGTLADELLDGKIDVEPYRLNLHMPCPYCAFKSVCRYEIELQPPRTLESRKASDVLKIMAGEPLND